MFFSKAPVLTDLRSRILSNLSLLPLDQPHQFNHPFLIVGSAKLVADLACQHAVSSGQSAFRRLDCDTAFIW